MQLALKRRTSEGSTISRDWGAKLACKQPKNSSIPTIHAAKLVNFCLGGLEVEHLPYLYEDADAKESNATCDIIPGPGLKYVQHE